MRTNPSAFLQVAADFLGVSRRYRVSGQINFSLHLPEGGHDYLKEAITEVNKAFPWRDNCPEPEEHDQNGGQPIFFLTQEPGVLVDDPECALLGGRYVVRFSVRHSQSLVGKGQVYGYEQYLAKLVQVLTEKKLRNISRIWGVLEMQAIVLAS